MTLRIELVNNSDYREIFDFEKDNRAFFESVLPPRVEDYYQYESFDKIMDQLMTEQENGEFYMYLIRENDQLIGRINLQISEEDNVKKAEVGYRIGEGFQGKGYATEAVKLIIEEASAQFSIKELVAGTAMNNIGSIKVLENNGFTLTGEEKNVFKINDVWIDGLLYSKSISSIV